METMVNREMLEFDVDTRLVEPENRKTGIPFHLQKQDVSLIVQWGDGTNSILKSSDYTIEDASVSVHEYAVPGRYHISISIDSQHTWSEVYISTLDCSDSVFECVPSLFNAKTECMRYFKKTLEAITSPLPNLKGTLQYTLSDPSKSCNGLRLDDNFAFLFIHCIALKSICRKLFSNIRHSISFSYAFYGCRSLEEIPEELFKGCIDVLSYAYCFYGCYSLSSIPSGLFRNSYKAQGFKGVFKDCLNVTSIPEDLFKGNHHAEVFSEAFQNCLSIQSIPEKLFAKCPNAIGFSSTFENCINIIEIPEMLFASCRRAFYFRSVFSKSGIKSIPEKLFAGMKNVTTYSYAFSWCSNLVEVPGSLFHDSLYVKDFSGCFYGCKDLQKIGRKLFSNAVYARKFSHCFYGCRSLKKAVIEIASRVVDTVYLFVQKSPDASIVIVAQSMSTTARLLEAKSKELGIKVVEGFFFKGPFHAFLQSILRIIRRD